MDDKYMISYLSSTSWKISRLCLERIQELLRKMDHPEKNLKFIHIGGTNGKGSTASMLAGMLTCAGYRTGLYLSPYIHHFNERIQINGHPIPDPELEQIMRRVSRLVNAMREHPTEFERTTAAAFYYFNQQACDIVILEVGLGGRLDATNVITEPLLSILTPISLDHTVQLGETLEKTAWEKTGIIKSCRPVISAPQKQSVAEIIQEQCRKQNAALTEVDTCCLEPAGQTENFQIFHWQAYQNLHLSLMGDFQRENAATALTAIEKLKSMGWSIPESSLREGLETTCFPGRFETLQDRPRFIVDSGHNPHSAQAVVRNLNLLFPGRKFIFITGVLADKQYKDMYAILSPAAKYYITITPPSVKGMRADKLGEFLTRYNVPVHPCTSVENGIQTALKMAKESDVICAFGSIYSVRFIREYFRRA